MHEHEKQRMKLLQSFGIGCLDSLIMIALSY